MPGYVYELVVALSTYLFLTFTALSFACGLFYIADIAEEYPSNTRKVLRILAVVPAVLSFLMLIEGAPFFASAVNIGAHACYYLATATFPEIKLSQPAVSAGIVLFLLDNYLWWAFFSSQNYGDDYFYEELHRLMGFFFLLVWLLPLSLLCTVSLGSDSLPMNMAPGDAQKKPSSLKAMLEQCKCKRKSNSNNAEQQGRGARGGTSHNAAQRNFNSGGQTSFSHHQPSSSFSPTPQSPSHINTLQPQQPSHTNSKMQQQQQQQQQVWPTGLQGMGSPQQGQTMYGNASPVYGQQGVSMRRRGQEF